MRTIQQRFSRRRTVAIALGSSLTILQNTLTRRTAVREYLLKRDRSAGKVSPSRAATL